jgi:transcriptional regulator GlxA family with amidase domain
MVGLGIGETIPSFCEDTRKIFPQTNRQKGMIKLDNSQDWLESARQANWSVTRMSRLYGVSSRTLERYFLENTGQTPKTWLSEQRQWQAGEILQENNVSVKEVAIRLGYKHAHHFSREFKKYWGICPTDF